MLHYPNTTGVKRSLGDSFNIRMLIHFTGDMHQPLHTTSRFSKDFPNGDQGGNFFKLVAKPNETEQITNLHALWDSTVYEWDEDIPQPLSDEGWEKLGNISSFLRKQHTDRSYDIAQALKKPESTWAQEGHDIAEAFVYKIEKNTLPSEEYVAIAQ